MRALTAILASLVLVAVPAASIAHPEDAEAGLEAWHLYSERIPLSGGAEPDRTEMRTVHVPPGWGVQARWDVAEDVFTVQPVDLGLALDLRVLTHQEETGANCVNASPQHWAWNNGEDAVHLAGAGNWYACLHEFHRGPIESVEMATTGDDWAFVDGTDYVQGENAFEAWFMMTCVVAGGHQGELNDGVKTVSCTLAVLGHGPDQYDVWNSRNGNMHTVGATVTHIGH